MASFISRLSRMLRLGYRAISVLPGGQARFAVSAGVHCRVRTLACRCSCAGALDAAQYAHWLVAAAMLVLSALWGRWRLNRCSLAYSRCSNRTDNPGHGECPVEASLPLRFCVEQNVRTHPWSLHCQGNNLHHLTLHANRFQDLPSPGKGALRNLSDGDLNLDHGIRCDTTRVF